MATASLGVKSFRSKFSAAQAPGDSLAAASVRNGDVVALIPPLRRPVTER